MMKNAALWWFLLDVFSIFFLGFYSMIEMACVSFNKVRLHYYVSQGNKRAKWLNELLQHPFRLFGTTLIGVNVAMIIGSEFSREFYRALGLNPDIAPLTQVALVVIFGELAPMFAARHFAENVAMRGVPLLYASSKLLTPILWLIGVITKLTNSLVQGNTHGNIFLSQEELQTILEEHGEGSIGTPSEEFNTITQNIFLLRHKDAKQCLNPLKKYPRLPSNSTISQMKSLLKRTNADFVPIYSLEVQNIVGIAFPRDLIRASNNRRVRDFARPPWFVTEQTPLTHILQQFQHNNQNVAVILDNLGKAKGLITLDDILAEIFDEGAFKLKKVKTFIVDRNFSGTKLVGEFNKQFGVVLDTDESLTLAELMNKILGRQPQQGETALTNIFELTAVETSLLEVKSVNIKSRLV
jgi:putative hemolysin